MSKFSQRLIELRTEKNLSQRELADAAGLSRGAVSHYETGERTPALHCLIALSRYFGCSIDFLVGEKDY